MISDSPDSEEAERRARAHNGLDEDLDLDSSLGQGQALDSAVPMEATQKDPRTTGVYSRTNMSVHYDKGDEPDTSECGDCGGQRGVGGYCKTCGEEETQVPTEDEEDPLGLSKDESPVSLTRAMERAPVLTTKFSRDLPT